ncbi:hypothetical protein KSP39_PZI001472 [Platanthera zijinensis]|uniref:1-phosphatidylinositol 4-kinase n=1 Tax=Platanthera zijinensis TaxID=2320716 RepID=A0AAP0C217_9ASPA
MSSAGIAVRCFREDQVLSPARKQHSQSLHYSDDSVLIYLTVPGSSVIPMRVLDSDSIAAVKLRIQSRRGFVVKNQKLVFDGRELARNDCRIRDYGVSDGNLVHLLIRLSDLRFVTVNTPSGDKFEFQIQRNRDVVNNSNNLSTDSPANVEKNIADDLKIDYSQPWIEPVVVNPLIKLSPTLEELISSTYDGLEKRHAPVMSSEGSGGVYFMKDGSGRKYVSVFKPTDEEPMAENNPRGLPLSPDGEGLKRGTRVGEGALREVAAYILDHPAGGRRSFLSDEPGFSGVPPTVMVRCLRGGGDEAKDLKVGSLQKFVKNCGTCEDMGPRAFPVEEVHKIAVLDLRLANVDRHAGNILVCREEEEGKVMLVPIDHGYCLPEHFEDCTFDWLFWPQARQPFNSAALEYINSLDAEKDIALLKFYGWEPSPECSRTFRISTMLLKKGARRGLSPYDIGNILCRETIKKESKIEKMISEAMDAVLPGSSEAAFLDAISEIMDHYLNKLAQ